MPTREKTLLLALCLAAAVAPARAQIPAPRLVEDGEEAVDEAAPPPAPPEGAFEHPTATATSTETSSSRETSSSTATSTPPQAAAADLARRIVPVQTSFAKMMALWSERRAAQRAADPVRAEAAEKAFLASRAELGIANLFTLAAVEIREAHRALHSNLAGEAVAHARTAVRLAPDLPDAHLALARARFAGAPGKPRAVLSALRDALAAFAREPYTRRAFYGDIASAGFAALFFAALSTILLLIVRRLRLFLHDFHHLPLLRGTPSIQASFIGVILLAIPLALGAGPVITVAVALAAVWLYLDLAERFVATVAVAALLALPWGAGAAARMTAWSGSLAETVHVLEHGAVPDEQAAEIVARFADSPAPAALHAALGRHYKRRGDLDAALRQYQLAQAADPRAPEVQVDVGNVLFLRGDFEGAKAAYLAATDSAAGDLLVLGAAHYNLSKLYLRTADMPQSAAAREKAEREAGDFLRLNGSDDDFSANRYLVDVPVPDGKIQALMATDGAPQALQGWVQKRLAGSLPRTLWPWGPAAWLAGLWAAALAGAGRRAARACERCGGAACRRCDAGAGELCGQCVNVFVRKGVVDARDRLRKEAEVRRRRQAVGLATRALSIAAGGAGHVFNGAPVRGALLLLGILFSGFVVWFWRGVVPPPHPSPYLFAGKILVAVPVGLILWAMAVRDAFRHTE